MAQNLVLVDSSIWIQSFKRGGCLQREHLDGLLADDRVAICGPIKAEVLSGTSSLDDFRKLIQWFEGLHYFSIDNEKIWDIIAEKRFKLARKGIQQKLVDLLIACIAYEQDLPIWSLDEDFKKIIDVVPCKLYKL